jgi:hypothetical protein
MRLGSRDVATSPSVRVRSSLSGNGKGTTQVRAASHQTIELPPLRCEVQEAAQTLRMSRAQVYNRIKAGLLTAQKDGARTYITWAELERYVVSCNKNSQPTDCL